MFRKAGELSHVADLPWERISPPGGEHGTRYTVQVELVGCRLTSSIVAFVVKISDAGNSGGFVSLDCPEMWEILNVFLTGGGPSAIDDRWSDVRMATSVLFAEKKKNRSFERTRPFQQ